MNVAIIKLGALGDVVRTLPIAEAIKKKYPDAEITWITKENALQLFEGNNKIDKSFAIPYKTSEVFDILYNFDIDKEATSLASVIIADKKYGFYSDGDYPAAFNLGAEYYLNTLFDDELKKNNRKTYQQMMFDAAELPYNKEMPKIYLTNKDLQYAENFIIENKILKNKLIGIHIGSSPRWPSKAWGNERIKEFIKEANSQSYDILLLAGPDDIKKQEKLITELKNNNIKVFTNDPYNSVKEFSALVKICQQMICSDSLSLHISLALKKPTIALFFCTTPHEVEGYGLLKKIVSPLYNDFFPERQDQYSEELINSISVEEVLNALK